MLALGAQADTAVVHVEPGHVGILRGNQLNLAARRG
jgi:3,4-dihydroxy-2-butanone 4-phosphate synthase